MGPKNGVRKPAQKSVALTVASPVTLGVLGSPPWLFEHSLPTGRSRARWGPLLTRQPRGHHSTTQDRHEAPACSALQLLPNAGPRLPAGNLRTWGGSSWRRHKSAQAEHRHHPHLDHRRAVPPHQPGQAQRCAQTLEAEGAGGVASPAGSRPGSDSGSAAGSATRVRRRPVCSSGSLVGRDMRSIARTLGREAEPKANRPGLTRCWSCDWLATLCPARK